MQVDDRTFLAGYLVSTCFYESRKGDGKRCPYGFVVGSLIFHSHYNALNKARMRNRLAGRKLWRVAITRDGHFAVVEVAQVSGNR